MPRFLFIGQGACRSGLLILIRSSFSKAEISTTSNLEHGLSRIADDRHIDLVLMDADPSCLSLIDRVKPICACNPEVRFAVISYSDSRECISSSLEGGLRGFILKRQSDEDIVAAIKQILSGGVYIPWNSSGAQASTLSISKAEECSCQSCAPDNVVAKMTHRQHQVLQLLSQGMSNKEIARALHIAELTTKIHTSNVMRVLGARNRTEAAFKAGKLLSAIEHRPAYILPPRH